MIVSVIPNLDKRGSSETVEKIGVFLKECGIKAYLPDSICCAGYENAKEDYINDEDKVVVLTPNGLRQLKKNIPDSNIFSVLVESNLGTRMKRYIDRCGVDKFNFDDKNEIASRVERDYGMFLGVNKDVNFVIHNNEGADLNKVVEEIMQCVKLAK